MRTIGIIQPNYIPWRGFFDFVHEVDVFVFLDDAQYTVRDWRNRNRIRTKQGETIWLTVPTVGGRDQLIKDVKIDDSQPWIRKHLRAIEHNYGQTRNFSEYFELLHEVYTRGFSSLSDLDIALTRTLSKCLGIETEFVIASTIESESESKKDDKLLQIVKHLQGEAYLSGPAAKAYLCDRLWRDAGVELVYKDYSGYPEYQQISEPFDAAVSVLDLLFMVGEKAPDYIWGEYRQRS